MTRWTGEDGWEVEIDRDCFDPEGPVVVVLQAVGNDPYVPVLATPSPEQAREIARELLRSADIADRANAQLGGSG